MASDNNIYSFFCIYLFIYIFYTLFKGESLNGNNALVDNIPLDMDY